MGRKTKYEEDFPERVRAMSEEGMIEADMAKNLGVSSVTFEDYKNKYPDFLKSLKDGKVVTDDKVVSALLQRALGFEYKEKTIESYVDEEGKTKRIVKETVKRVIPSVAACFIWLKNRRPDEWCDKQEVDHSGKVSLVMDSRFKGV